MPNETKTPKTPSQQKSATKAKKTRLNRLADEAARRGAKRGQRYDRDHNIFTT
jgi:hypothetical protein